MRKLCLRLAVILLITTCSGCFWGWDRGRGGHDDRDRGNYGDHDRGGYGEHEEQH
jgi:hypothetical protein